MKKVILCATIGSVLLITGCERVPEHHVTKVAKKYNHLDSTPIFQNEVDGIFWYYMFANPYSNSCPCYTYSSPTPVSNFSNANFARSTTLPASLPSASSRVSLTKVGNSNQLDEKEQQEVENDVEEAINEPNAELGEEVEVEVTETVESDTSPDTSSVESSDSSSGDSGGGDSGGGE